ncbi:hypothetical protein HanPI659440_Chr08g0286381 [Helianthus annuus]|nr:hypothetical protein HanPI659440_Chr08g0286381 [Helianthus annuus]
MGHVLMSPPLDRPIRAMAQLSHYIKRTSFPKKGQRRLSPQKGYYLLHFSKITPVTLLSLSLNYTYTYNMFTIQDTDLSVRVPTG